MTSFDALYEKWNWQEIRNCPGRYVLSGPGRNSSPEEVIGHPGSFHEYNVTGAKDIVIVWKFDGGGLISYKKEDGSFVHTLNTEEGFKRKLKNLGILKT